MPQAFLARAALAAALLVAAPTTPALAQVSTVTATQSSAPATLSPVEIERRVEELLGRMTLDEKVGQLNLVGYGDDYSADLVRRGRIGNIMNFSNASLASEAQKAASESRLGIPLLNGLDIVHGFRTLFPIPLAEAAAFDLDLARRSAEASGREAIAAGINWTFGPMADVSRDLRWGRLIEGGGEDVFLTTRITAARVEGFRAGGIGTSAKHFAGYGAGIGGRDYDAADIAPADLRDVYLPPFRAAVEAGTDTVMTAFTALDGVPGAVNAWLLNGVLRREWGFDGFVVSDFAGIHELLAHGVAADAVEATRKAILAGVDVDMMSNYYDKHLANEVRAGRVPQAVVDDAVRRVLRVKFRLGLFGRPLPTEEAAARADLTPEIRALAREIARDSFVLLENRDGVLPLRSEARTIAVVGPFVDSAADQNGAHAARGDMVDTITYLEALRLRGEWDGRRILHAPGCSRACDGTDGFAAAVEAARAADVVVAVLGEPEHLTGEAATRASIDLPGRQRELLDALLATGRPVVLAMQSGRPLDLGAARERLAAHLMLWYPGHEGGPALAEVLFVDVAPSGKLPVTYPRSLGQLPAYYDRLPSGRPFRADNRFTMKYIDAETSPLHPFGFGLSYTTFAYADLAVATPRVGPEDEVEVSVRLTNTGPRAGREVAQLYVRDLVASRSRPVRQLKGFDKVALGPGESRTVTFRVPVAELGFHQPDGSYVVEPGAFEAWIGGSSAAALSGRFEVTEGLRREP
jgi:beta-glucosidase